MLLGYILVERPDLYEQVNRIAVVFYQGLLGRGEYREYYLIELLYHRLMLLRDNKDVVVSTMQEELGAEIQKYLESNIPALYQDTDLISLRNSLMRDSDLKDYIPSQVLSAIRQRIKSQSIWEAAMPRQS